MGRTAGDLSAAERAAYREALLQHQRMREAALRARAGRALSAARAAAALLRREFGARRVLLFGSLARGRFGARSDVDLAVEGMRHEDLLRAHARVSYLFEDAEVDLVPIEDASQPLRQRIESEGIPL